MLCGLSILFQNLLRGLGLYPCRPCRLRLRLPPPCPCPYSARALASKCCFHRTAHSAPGFWHFRQGCRRGGRKVLLLPPPSNSSPSTTSTPPAAITSASVQPSIYWGFAAVLGIPGTPQTRLCLIRLIPESESDVFFEIPKNRT